MGDAELERWRTFRERFGLRTDDAWIARVAADPAAQNDTGIPLLPFELDIIGQVNLSLDGILGVLRAYGEEHRDQYGGVVVDSETAGVVVLLMTGDLEVHRAAVRTLVPPGGRVGTDVRKVRWSLDRLEDYREGVLADTAWLGAIDARVFDVDVLANETNAVRLRYEAASDTRDWEILAHYGNPPWLEVMWEGPLPWTGPRGDLVIRVVDVEGRPLAGYVCDATPVEPSVYYDTAIEIPTDGEGRCRLDDLPAATFIITVTGDSALGDHRRGSGRVRVPSGDTGTVTIVAQ